MVLNKIKVGDSHLYYLISALLLLNHKLLTVHNHNALIASIYLLTSKVVANTILLCSLDCGDAGRSCNSCIDCCCCWVKSNSNC